MPLNLPSTSQENQAEVVELTSDNLCRTTNDLINSPLLEQVIKVFNGRELKQGRPEVTKEQVTSEYDVAQRVSQYFFENFTVRSRAQDIPTREDPYAVVQSTIRNALFELRTRNPERKVPPGEVVDRLKDFFSLSRDLSTVNGLPVHPSSKEVLCALKEQELAVLIKEIESSKSVNDPVLLKKLVSSLRSFDPPLGFFIDQLSRKK